MFEQLLIALARHATVIPEALVRVPFLWAADVAWLLRLPSVRQLERNLSRVISDAGARRPGRRTLRRISHRGMRSYFAYFAEAMTVGGRTASQLDARIRGEGAGLDRLQTLTGNGGSAPLAMGHQGNWDYAGYWAYGALAPVTTVAERLRNPQLLETFVRIRRDLGMRILLTGSAHLTDRLREALQEPRVLVPLLADRDLGRHGEFVRAFGSTIRVARGPAILALDTGLPLFVVNMRRERLSGSRRKMAGTPCGYVCEINGPVDTTPYRDMPREQAIAAISQAWVDVWAQGVRKNPEDWHMLQTIFLDDMDRSRIKSYPDERQGA